MKEKIQPYSYVYHYVQSSISINGLTKWKLQADIAQILIIMLSVTTPFKIIIRLNLGVVARGGFLMEEVFKLKSTQ